MNKGEKIARLIVESINRHNILCLEGGYDNYNGAEMRMFDINLGRRAGHTTASKQLLHMHPDNVLVVPNSQYRQGVLSGVTGNILTVQQLLITKKDKRFNMLILDPYTLCYRILEEKNISPEQLLENFKYVVGLG